MICALEKIYQYQWLISVDKNYISGESFLIQIPKIPSDLRFSQTI